MSAVSDCAAADSRPPWRYFWLLFAAGFALRLIDAIGGDWSLRPDELMQYLEQAHRLVFGYGIVPWEFRFGVRTWLIPAIPAAPLYLAKFLQIDSPEIYIPLVNSWNAALSMAIPAGMYFYARRTVSETAARWALVFGCFWSEFLIFAPHALAENYSTAMFMAALAIGGQNRTRLLAAGFLLGLAAAVRLPHAPIIAIYGIFWLAALPRRFWAFPLFGGVCGLLLWGAVDYLTWGGWWASAANYLKIFALLSKTSEHSPFLNIFRIMQSSGGLYAVIALAAFYFRRRWALILMAATAIAVHSNPKNQEYTNIFIAFPLLWMLAGGALCEWGRTADKKRTAAAGVIIAAISCLGLANKLPFPHPAAGGAIPPKPLFLRKNPDYENTKTVRRAIANEPVRAIFWDAAAGRPSRMGGYYHLHRNTPLYFPRDARHIKILRESKLPPEKIFSHIVGRNTLPPPNFSASPLVFPFILHRNGNMAEITPLPYIYDSYGTFFVNMVLGRSEDFGVELPPFEYTPFRPEIK